MTSGVAGTASLLLNLIGGFSIAGLTSALVFGKWPQVVRPAALCFLSKVVATGLNIVATFLASALMGYAVYGSVPASNTAGAGSVATAVFGGTTFLFGVSVLVSISLAAFYLYLGRRAWRIDQEYRTLAGRMRASMTTSGMRKWLGRLAWGAAVYYALVLVGSSASAIYGMARALESLPRSTAVIKSSTGIAISGNPREWNNQAWRLATDPDPAKRDPGEAVKLAEQSVAAEPRNSTYLNTLGVARYRAGDYTGSIDALSRSLSDREVHAQNAFFLAMAHARLGRHDEAQRWFNAANQWIREHEKHTAWQSSGWRDERSTKNEPTCRARRGSSMLYAFTCLLTTGGQAGFREPA